MSMETIVFTKTPWPIIIQWQILDDWRILEICHWSPRSTAGIRRYSCR
jgi:hypothetical protein